MYDTVTGGTSNPNYTGDTQDTVSGEFDTPFRELHPGQRRWISPDPAGIAAVDPTDPQSWNRYAYVGNNPLSFIDPFGACTQITVSVLGTTTTHYYPDGGAPCVFGSMPNGYYFMTNSNNSSGGMTCFFGSQSPNCPSGQVCYANGPGSTNTPSITATVPPPPHKPSCTKPGLWTGAKAAFNDFFSPPGSDPTGDIGDTVRDKNVQRAAVGTLYVVANSARTLAPVLDIAADAIPVAGELLLAYQAGHALYEGGKAYKNSIDQCYATTP